MPVLAVGRTHRGLLRLPRVLLAVFCAFPGFTMTPPVQTGATSAEGGDGLEKLVAASAVELGCTRRRLPPLVPPRTMQLSRTLGYFVLPPPRRAECGSSREGERSRRERYRAVLAPQARAWHPSRRWLMGVWVHGLMASWAFSPEARQPRPTRSPPTEIHISGPGRADANIGSAAPTDASAGSAARRGCGQTAIRRRSGRHHHGKTHGQARAPCWS